MSDEMTFERSVSLSCAYGPSYFGGASSSAGHWTWFRAYQAYSGTVACPSVIASFETSIVNRSVAIANGPWY
jgi:hypothetical protein